MIPDNANNNPEPQPKPNDLSANDVVAAHEQAEADIENDDELSTEEDPTADLDEGELARLDNNTENVDV